MIVNTVLEFSSGPQETTIRVAMRTTSVKAMERWIGSMDLLIKESGIRASSTELGL
jgi:hypothetical protein